MTVGHDHGPSSHPGYDVYIHLGQIQARVAKILLESVVKIRECQAEVRHRNIEMSEQYQTVHLHSTDGIRQGLTSTYALVWNYRAEIKIGISFFSLYLTPSSLVHGSSKNVQVQNLTMFYRSRNLQEARILTSLYKQIQRFQYIVPLSFAFYKQKMIRRTTRLSTL